MYSFFTLTSFEPEGKDLKKEISSQEIKIFIFWQTHMKILVLSFFFSCAYAYLYLIDFL